METTLENMEAGAGALARERVLADLKSLAHDSEDLLKATAGDVTEKTKEARGRVTAALLRAKESCARLQEQTVVAAKKADVVIRTHPYESIGVALGVGVLIGVLVARK